MNPRRSASPADILSVAEQDLQGELTKCCNSLDVVAANNSCGCEVPSHYSLPVEIKKEQGLESLATAIMEFTLDLLAPEELTWVPAKELEPSDSLKSLNGLRQITNRRMDRISERVYNIEVDGDHVYRIGQSGLLVHNVSEYVYRGMKETTGGQPQAGPTARELGVRPGHDTPDAVKDDDIVDPDDGGMSVAPDNPQNLQSHRRPPSLGGTGKDPVWSISTSQLGSKLKYRRDNSSHGTILPATKMSLAEFQQALTDTASSWFKIC